MPNKAAAKKVATATKRATGASLAKAPGEKPTPTTARVARKKAVSATATPTRKATAKATAAKRAPATKAAAKKAPATKAAAKKAPAKKATAKAPAKKAGAKKATAQAPGKQARAKKAAAAVQARTIAETRTPAKKATTMESFGRRTTARRPNRGPVGRAGR
ncbi:hypothetical protein [Micromonospora coerulea]